MQNLMPPVDTSDNAFHDGDPTTGQLGTIVTAEWLNNVQGATRDTQAEIIAVLTKAGMQPNPQKKNQLAEAIGLIIGSGDYVTNSFLKLELLKKIDKADISQQLGNDTGKVPSLSLLVNELGKKAGVADVNGKLAKDQNGADIPDKPKFIENLGLGEAAKSNITHTTGTSKTNVMSQDGSTKAFMQIGAHGLGVRAIGDSNKPTSLSGAGFYATGGDVYKQIPANTLLVRFQGTADRFIGCASDGSNRVFFTDINGDPVDFYHSGNLRVLNSTGASAINPISQKAATDNMLGVGQSWGDYSGNRQIGTSYTNATSKAIEVFCSCVLPISGTSSVSLEVNGLVISQSAATSPGGNIRGNVSGIIPAGASYKVITSNTTDVRIWVELR